MEYQQADRDYIRLSIAFEGRAKQANELLRNFDSISELFEAVKNFNHDKTGAGRKTAAHGIGCLY